MSQIASTSSAERVNILHLSDLHFGREDKASQEVVLEYFLDDLRRLPILNGVLRLQFSRATLYTILISSLTMR